MKPIFSLCSLLITGFLLANAFSCRLIKKLINPDKPVTFQVFIDQKNYPGVEVKVAKHRVRTDNNGYGILPVAKYIGKEQYVYIKYEMLSVDTFFLVPLAARMPIYVGAGGVNIRSVIKHFSTQQDTLEQMHIQLDFVGDLLNDLKKELNTSR